MTYVVLPRPPYPAQLAWSVTDGMGRRYGCDAQVDALALANMLNMLTPDQRQAASVEAVAKLKDASTNG